MVNTDSSFFFVLFHPFGVYGISKSSFFLVSYVGYPLYCNVLKRSFLMCVRFFTIYGGIMLNFVCTTYTSHSHYHHHYYFGGDERLFFSLVSNLNQHQCSLQCNLWMFTHSRAKPHHYYMPIISSSREKLITTCGVGKRTFNNVVIIVVYCTNIYISTT